MKNTKNKVLAILLAMFMLASTSVFADSDEGNEDSTATSSEENVQTTTAPSSDRNNDGVVDPFEKCAFVDGRGEEACKKPEPKLYNENSPMMNVN
jgi:hypothetical protein